MLLIQCRREMAVLPAVTVLLLHHSAIVTRTDSNNFRTGYRGNGVSS